MPYDYYMVVRFTTMAVCGYKAFLYFNDGKNKWGYLFSLFAILFQPFFKIALHKPTWNAIDIILAVILLIECLIYYKASNEK